MEMDIGNTALLRAGYQANATGRKGDWLPMDAAPRDGSVVELRCSYGVAPWYGLFRWTTEHPVQHINGNSGESHYETRIGEPSWEYADGRGGGPFSESHLSWRPTDQEPARYLDPTGGAQDSAAYWRGACAPQRGLPMDYCEGETARNVARKAAPRRKFLGIF